ncbi:hypothetical protein NDU88_000630 [Pleurodeles waltl]|uniref:Uncharacterized protein n=1 Tax=Pleurodeles waltl TaxID=8319 RepID=A0AAV7UQI6_PLEWA|nr:hypothetical protein NDU88_000630 [Pleurodeles waltl]
MRQSRCFTAGSHPCSHSSPLQARPAQLRATRYSDVRRPMSDIPAVLPLTAIGSSTYMQHRSLELSESLAFFPHMKRFKDRARWLNSFFQVLRPPTIC